MRQLIKNLRKSGALILDTETTGLDNRAEIVQIGIVSLDGSELFNSLVQPAKARRWPDATQVHGITWSGVKDAPTMGQLADELKQVMDGRLIAIYNAEFDTRMLRQSIRAAGATDEYQWLLDQAWEWECVMEAYAEYWGERNRRYGGYRWQSLINAWRQQGLRVSNAHSALGDAKLTAALIRKIEKKFSHGPDGAA